MKIKSISVAIVDRPLSTPWKIATAEVKSLNAALVRVEADDGTIGYGECCARVGPEVIPSVIASVLAPVLIGKDARNIEALWEAMYATLRTRGHSRGFLIEALSGIDIALWDLMGRKLGQPVSALLFGFGRSSIKAYASSILIDDPDVMAREAADLKKSGYDAIKIKISGSVAEDVERVRAVREAVGKDVNVLLDANSGFSAPDAIAFSSLVKASDVFWLEEPIVLDDLPSYRRLRAASGIRIALGEGEFTTAGFREFIVGGLIDVAQPNITRAGGFTGVRKIAALAQAFGVAVAPHTGASGPICMAATLQLMGGLGGVLMHEHMFLENPFKSFFRTPLPGPANGSIAIPEGPGLGVEIADDEVQWSPVS